MDKVKFKVGNLVKVSEASNEIYRISWVGAAFDCQIQARKSNGDWHSAQYFDTSLLIKA